MSGKKLVDASFVALDKMKSRQRISLSHSFQTIRHAPCVVDDSGSAWPTLVRAM